MKLLAFMVLMLFIGTSITASNNIPSSNLGKTTQTITANTLKPSTCASITLTNIVIGSGNISGTNANDLILGSSGVDNISGRSGNDCILGGGGNDSINGNGGTDICIGGPGTDTFSSCSVQVQ